MSKRELDPVSGVETTGHEWNGITELDTPVPKVIVGWYGVSIAVAVLLILLLPSIPLISTFTPGFMGYTSRGSVEAELQQSVARQGDWQNRMANLDVDSIAADADLKTIALAGGQAAFKINCVVCHGEQGLGQTGFPRLTDQVWQWGGSLEAIEETIRVGINAKHDETRYGEMLAFGRDQILDRDQVIAATHYVRSLSGLDHDTAMANDGAEIFVENCESCHGEAGIGSQDVGAPNLSDQDWLYGAEFSDVYETIHQGRLGWMPHWDERLDPEVIKMLSIYVRSLSAAE